MGAWGSGPFDNDDAADWLYELEESSGLEAIRAALETIDPDGYPEAPDCNMALSAAEVIAAVEGQPHDALPLEVAAWVEEHGDGIDDELVGRALAAVQRIESESELKDLWKESDEFDAWAGNVQDLKDRLGSI